MRLLIQRVREARVTVEGRVVGEIGPGLLVLAGFGGADTPALPLSRTWSALLDKMTLLRVFPDAAGKMNLGLADFGGEILLVSQFTLYADTRKGRRPSFHLAAPPAVAEPLFQALVRDMEARLPGRVRRGIFAADMDVSLINWGPVTLLLDSAEMTGEPS